MAQAWYELDRVDEAREALLHCRTVRAASADLRLRAAQVFGRIMSLRESPQDALAYFTRAEVHFRAIGAHRGAWLASDSVVLSYGDLRHARSMQTALDEIASTHADTDPQFAEVGAVVAMSRTRLLLAMGLAREALIALDAARPSSVR
jgi:LuxR family maltose regulon positive regulatory protein